MPGDAFGNIVQQTASINQPFTYTGREWDAGTGLYYYRARYYDPMIGRFLSEDPIGFEGGINFYTYVGNNPINFTDPSGNFAFVIPLVIGGIELLEFAGGVIIGTVVGTEIVKKWNRSPQQEPERPMAPYVPPPPVECKRNTRCVAKCSLRLSPGCSGHLTGEYSAPDEETACREAKRIAVHDPKRGNCDVGHCKCTCQK